MGLRPTAVALSVILTACLMSEAGAGLRLSPVGKPIHLDKTSGRIDQAILLPDRSILVRDSDFWHPDTQGLEIYSPSGHLSGRIGSFGRSPGSFYRLKEVAITRDRSVWVADVVGRLSFFNPGGKLLGTKLIQHPGFQVDGLAIDEARGVFYLGGCLPEAVYLDSGCRLVHQYRLADKSYLRSYLQTDREVFDKGLFSLQNTLVTLDDQGRVFAADAPVFKLSRLDPRTGQVQAFPILSSGARPVSAVKDPASAKAVYRSSFLLHRLLTAGPFVVVSIRQPEERGFLLAVFTLDGKQVATDVASPGMLVGKTSEGRLLFARRSQGGYELCSYSLAEESH